MANIVQQPQEYSFSGNLGDLVVMSGRAIAFAIDGLLEERYEPDATGRVVIPLRAFFEAHLHAPGLDEIPAEGLPLTTYTYSIDGEEAGSFCVLPGGVNAESIDTPLFLKSNFLTWQPQTRYVGYHEPQWLRYVALNDCVVRVKGSSAQPNETETVTSTRESMGSGYSCSGTYKQNYTTYRNVFKFSDTTQYSSNYNVNSGSAAQVDGYCGYTATKYYICGASGNTFAECPEYYYFGIGLSASWPGMKFNTIPNNAKGCQCLCFYKTTDTSTRVKIQSARLVNVSSPFYVSIRESFSSPSEYVTIEWNPYYDSDGPGSMAFGRSSLDYTSFTLEVTLTTGKKLTIEGIITRNDYEAGVAPWQTPPRNKNTQY